MKAILYILLCNESEYYVGSTIDLERRLREHRRGQTPSTRKYTSVKLVFTQEFGSLPEARMIERKIKSWKRKDFIEKIVIEGRIKVTGP